MKEAAKKRSQAKQVRKRKPKTKTNKFSH